MKTFEEHAEGLVDVLERTIHAQVLKQLDEPLAKIVHNVVREAVTTAAGVDQRKPVHGGKCREVWDALDAVRYATGQLPSLQEAKDLAKLRHWNENTARIQYYRWRNNGQGSAQA